MRIGVAQLNATVGDLDGNLALAVDAYEQLVGQGVDLVVYPEMFLCGYPPRDLLLKTRFVSDLNGGPALLAGLPGQDGDRGSGLLLALEAAAPPPPAAAGPRRAGKWWR